MRGKEQKAWFKRTVQESDSTFRTLVSPTPIVGPAGDKHAGGRSNDKRYPEHRYLNIIGGFPAVIVDRPDGEPTIAFRHYSVDGDVLNEEVVTAKW
jgi:alkaline phosphatase D